MRKLLICLCMMVFICSCVKDKNSKEVENEDDIVEASFLAVGDNIVHSTIYKYNKVGDGQYYFDDIFQNTNDLVKSVDLAYINMETLCAGKELKLSNYPRFNGPVEMIDAVKNAGFDWLSGASNHSMDRGEKGILTQLEYVHSHYPELTMTGLHDSWEDANECVVLNVNGLRIGVLDYTYGLNGLEVPYGKEYLVDLIDKDKMKKDMDKINAVSDVQFVSIHWGLEYHFEPSDQQKDLAQYLSDLGAEVIIGTHPHVIQPIEYLTGKEGNQTLVMYSLGNFLSAQDQGDCMLGGMMMWKLQYNYTKDILCFKDVQFLPTVTQMENGFKMYRTYALKDWTDELAQRHTLAKRGQKVSRQYYIDLAKEVVGDQVEIIYE